MRLLTEYLKLKDIKLSSVINTFMSMFSRDTIEIFDEIEKIDDNKVPVNDNNIPLIPLDNIPNDNNPRIDASDTIDGRYDSGVFIL